MDDVEREIVIAKIQLIDHIMENLCLRELTRDGRTYLENLKIQMNNKIKDDT